MRQGLDEVVPRQGRLVDAPEARVLPLEAGLALLLLGGLGASDVAGLGPQDEVEDELDGIYLKRNGKKRRKKKVRYVLGEKRDTLTRLWSREVWVY